MRVFILAAAFAILALPALAAEPAPAPLPPAEAAAGAKPTPPPQDLLATVYRQMLDNANAQLATAIVQAQKQIAQLRIQAADLQKQLDAAKAPPENK